MELNRQDEGLLKQAEVFSRAAGPLFKLKKILVPVDFSECSNKALDYAVAFAGQLGADLTVLHVIPPYYAVPYGLNQCEEIQAELQQAGQEKLMQLVCDEVPPPLRAKTFLRTGRPATEIIDAARELAADIIIISTHGHTGLKHAFFGSTAEEVVRRAPCPVLTVREKEHDFIGG